MLKICSTCKIIKSLDEFEKDSRRNNGRGSRCKKCCTQNRLIEHSYRYVEKHREKERARHREKARKYGYRKVRDPIKEKARAAVRNAVAAGKIFKPNECSSCNQTGCIQAHHHDYSKPFEFVWLCSICHGKEHRAHAALTEHPSKG